MPPVELGLVEYLIYGCLGGALLGLGIAKVLSFFTRDRGKRDADGSDAILFMPSGSDSSDAGGGCD